MKKNIIVRCVFGGTVGISFSLIITIIISAFIGDGVFYPVVPQMVSACSGELNAVILQTVLSAFYGAVWSLASFIWQTNWSLLRQTVAHLILSSVSTFIVAYLCYWMKHSVLSAIIYFSIFFIMYFAIWLFQYIAIKKRIKAFNEKL